MQPVQIIEEAEAEPTTAEVLTPEELDLVGGGGVGSGGSGSPQA